MREVRRYRIIDPRVFLARSVDPGVVREVGFDRDGRLAGLELGLHFPAIDRKAPEDLPHSGGDSGPMVIEPNGRIDVLYQGYHITKTTTYAMTPAHSYFTSSSDGGQTWSSPVLVGADHPELTMSLSEWWIDGAIATDSAGNLYATWDTQSGSSDVGWLSFSTDHGRRWSNLVRVTPDVDNAAHIVEVAGGRAGIAYVGWLTNASPKGYSEYLREYSITGGWLTSPIRVSGNRYGAPPVWPGDTFGISTLPGAGVVLTWGGGVAISGQPKSEIFAATVHF